MLCLIIGLLLLFPGSQYFNENRYCKASTIETTTNQSNQTIIRRHNLMKTDIKQSSSAVTSTRTHNRNKKYGVAICACFLNEDDALVEWIEFHLMVGVSKIFLFHLDNHIHKNRWRHLLWPYVKRGQVVIHPQVFTYLGQWSFGQISSLQYYFDTYRHDFEWLAFNDVDEFIVPRNSSVSLPNLLRAYRNESGLVLPWRSFGPVVDFNESHGKLPRITEVTNATVYDYRKGYFARLSAIVNIIVNTNHASAEHCFFPFVKYDGRFVSYAHNCLHRAPSPPVNEHFIPLNKPWDVPYPATSDIIQLNHYFARSCRHFFGEKAESRLISIRKRYGNNIPEWDRFRYGIGLGNTTTEKCANTHASFNTSDTTIVEWGRRVWAKLDSPDHRARRRNEERQTPPRGSCHACLPHQAYCIDLLQRRADHIDAVCMCHEPMMGDGRTFCGNVTWATSVETSAPGNFSYLLGAPSGDRRSSSWTDIPRSSDFTVSFGYHRNVSISDVRMVAIYQPFSPSQLATLSYTHSRSLGQEESTEVIDLGTVQQPGQENPYFLLIPVGRVSLRRIIIRFSDPILLGAVGVVVAL